MSISRENIDRVCEILANNGDIIATGRIVDINEKHTKITNRVREMSLLKVGSLVKMRVHSYEGNVETYDACVKQSARNALYLMNVELLSGEEKREFFRVAVRLHTKAYPYTDRKELRETDAFKVKIKDLSIRGCFLATSKEFSEGQRIKIVLPLRHTQVYDCTVMRIVDKNKGSEYGCSFDSLTSQQEDLICQFIFEEQRKMILRVKRLD